MNFEWPKFTIVMATLNSIRTVELALIAIRQQDYPAEKIEVLLVDGGSVDGTRELAKQYGCVLIDNPQVDPVSAKILGLKSATGRYLMHIDSDEVLVSAQTLRAHATAYKNFPQVKMVFSAGYINPPGVPFAARYINEFGDPFSMYYYRLSKNIQFFAKDLARTCRRLTEKEGATLFEVGKKRQPLMENAACANSIDLQFFRSRFHKLCDNPSGPVHFFYHMQDETRQFAIADDTPVRHYSADSFSGLLNKIKWRVRNNIFFSDRLGAAGFVGRQNVTHSGLDLRRFGYIPYAFLLVPCVVDALYLMWTRRDLAYWRHVPLTLYTASLICIMVVGRSLGYRPHLKSYGEQKTILPSPRPSQ